MPSTELEKNIAPISEVNLPEGHAPIASAPKAFSAEDGNIALVCARQAQKSLIQVAMMLKEEKIALGNLYLAHCVDGLERFYQSLFFVKQNLHLTADTRLYDGWSCSDLETQFTEILKGIVVTQESKDFLELADRIEFELIPHLSVWIFGLERWVQTHRSNA